MLLSRQAVHEMHDECDVHSTIFRPQQVGRLFLGVADLDTGVSCASGRTATDS